MNEDNKKKRLDPNFPKKRELDKIIKKESEKLCPQCGGKRYVPSRTVRGNFEHVSSTLCSRCGGYGTVPKRRNNK